MDKIIKIVILFQKSFHHIAALQSHSEILQFQVTKDLNW